MFETLYKIIDTYITQKLKLVCFGFLLLIGVSIVGLFYIEFDNDICTMLPNKSEINRSLSFFRESSVADKVILSVSLKDSVVDTDRLIDAANSLACDIFGDFIDEVLVTLPDIDVRKQVTDYASFLPQIITPEQLKSLELELTGKNVKKRVGAIYRGLLSPVGNMMLPLQLKDPFGLSKNALTELSQVASSVGYSVKIVKNHLLSEDGSNLLIIVKTPVSLTDGFGAKKLINYLDSVITNHESLLNVIVVAGHRHSISNEEVIKRDVKKIFIVSLISFTLLFLLFFKDLRSGCIFIIPFCSIFPSLIITYLIQGTLSYIAVGFGSVIVGIAIDYGIHVYIAQRIGAESTRYVVKPVVAGALTTLSVFTAFFFSSVSGYKQIALFSSSSILFCLFFSIFLLPKLIKPNASKLEQSFHKQSLSNPDRKKFSYLAVFIWLLVMSLCFIFTDPASISTDVRQFDGSEEQVFSDEAMFRKIWGGEEEPAVLVVEANDLEKALQLNDSVALEVRKLISDDQFLSLSSFWASLETRRKRVLAWKRFWEEDKIQSVKSGVSKAATSYGLHGNAFAPFFDLLDADNQILKVGFPENSDLFDQIEDKFIMSYGGKVKVISFLKDKSHNVTALEPLVSSNDSVFLVSRQQFTDLISSSFSYEIKRLATLAGLGIMFLVIIMLPSFRLSVLALIPVITSVVIMLHTLSIFGMKVTPASLVAGMIVIGLAIDYGIFMVYNLHFPFKSGTMSAVTLSALTTITGAGALLFAVHPVMFTIGLTLVSGIAAGYLCSVFVLPALYKILARK